MADGVGLLYYYAFAADSSECHNIRCCSWLLPESFSVEPSVKRFQDDGLTACGSQHRLLHCNAQGKWKWRSMAAGYRLLPGHAKVAVQPNVFTYNTLFSSFDKAFQWHLALNLFSKMDKGPTPVASDTVSLAFVINSCAKGLQCSIHHKCCKAFLHWLGSGSKEFLEAILGYFRSINFSNEIWIAWKRRCRLCDKCNKTALGRSVADVGKHRWRASRGCSLHFGMSGLGHLCRAMWWCWALNDKPGWDEKCWSCASFSQKRSLASGQRRGTQTCCTEIVRNLESLHLYMKLFSPKHFYMYIFLSEHIQHASRKS